MNNRKISVLVILSLFFVILAFGIAQTAQDTANINNIFEVVVNNTNLAPNVPGHPFGTGERVSGNVYWTNQTPIEIFLFAHADTAGQNAQINLSVNGIQVLKTALRPAGTAENTYSELNAIIPKNSYYQADFSNYHHYEWREYVILSGKNGTLSVNQINITNTSVSDSQLNLKVNKSGDTITRELMFNGTNAATGNVSSGYINMTDPGNGSSTNYLTVGVKSWGKPNLRIQVDNIDSHIGFNIGGTLNSQVAVGTDSQDNGKVEIRGHNMVIGGDQQEYSSISQEEGGMNVSVFKGELFINLLDSHFISILHNITSTLPILSIRNPTDTKAAFVMYANKLEWGSGGSSNRDTNLYRAGTDSLKTDDNLTVGKLSGTGNAAVCVDSTGKLYRSTNATSNYLTC